MRIGYVGLGNMGAALARRLLLTHPLAVHDLNQAAVQRLSEAGATPCESPAALASMCETILLCLPTPEHVRTVVFGPQGVAAGARPGTLIIDQTTGDPGATRSMAADLAGHRIELIDAPVSGGVAGAVAGAIAIMVGASEAQLERARPVLNGISPNIFHAGGVGAGHVMKLVNNMLSGAQRLLTFEAVSLAAKNGIDPKRACEVLLAGGGRNSFLEKFMAPRVVNGDLVSDFSLGLIEKDIRLACQLGSDSGVPLAYGDLTLELYRQVIAEQGEGAEINTAALTADRRAGSRMVPPNPRLA
jgi:3-hydroxyisobutyrate dehydrogenase